MALGACRECGQQVSNEAKTCPHCGVSRPVKARMSRGAVVAIALVVLFVIVIAGGERELANPAPTKQELATAAADAQRSAEITRVAAGAKLLREQMRNPKSFELIEAIGGRNETLCYKYRAQNGFGGMNVAALLVGPRGGWVKEDSESGFVADWNTYCAGQDVVTDLVRRRLD